MGLFWHGAKFPIGMHCIHSDSITVERLTLGASNLVCSQKIMVLGQKQKFDPQNGRGLWSRDHFQNFRKTPTFHEWLKVGS